MPQLLEASVYTRIEWRGLVKAVGCSIVLRVLFACSAAHADLPSEHADVSIVEIPLFVYDSKGRPVTDLHEWEVRVFEDGKRQRIELFAPFHTPVRTEAFPAAAPQATSPDSPNALREDFVVVLDFWMNYEDGVVRMHDAALDFVKRKMRDGDRAAVFTLTRARGVEMLANFTSDRSLLTTAIESQWQKGLPRAVPEAAALYPGRSGIVDPLTGVDRRHLFGTPWTLDSSMAPPIDNPLGLAGMECMDLCRRICRRGIAGDQLLLSHPSVIRSSPICGRSST